VAFEAGGDPRDEEPVEVCGRELISTAITWSGTTAAELLEALPSRMLVRLEEIEVADESLERWAELTASDA
jgi:hypothetical protein